MSSRGGNLKGRRIWPKLRQCSSSSSARLYRLMEEGFVHKTEKHWRSVILVPPHSCSGIQIVENFYIISNSKLFHIVSTKICIKGYKHHGQFEWTNYGNFFCFLFMYLWGTFLSSREAVNLILNNFLTSLGMKIV